LFEFYKDTKIKKEEQRRVNKYARARNKGAIIKWLETKGITDAFIILVSKNKISITPVVAGKPKKVRSYSANLSVAQKQKQFDQIITKETPIKAKSGIPSGKIQLSKNIGRYLRRSFHVLGLFNVPLARASDFVNPGFGGRIDGYYRLLWPWFYPYVQLGGFFSSGKKSDLLNTSFFYAQAGLAYPISLFRSLMFSPFVAWGAHGVKVDSFFIHPSVDAGFNIDWYFMKDIGLSTSFSVSYLFDNDVTTLFVQIFVGAAFRF